MTKRTVMLTIEMKTDIPITKLRNKGGYRFQSAWGSAEVTQVQVNVIQPTKKKARPRNKKRR